MAINPKQQSLLFQETAASYIKVNTVVGGTEAMRAAANAYLPQGERETDTNYKNRLNSSVMVPYYREALDNTTAAGMKKPLIVTAPTKVSALLDNVDGVGSSLDQFATERFWNGLHFGATYVAVEFPKVEVAPNNLAEARAIKAQPYLVPIQSPQVLAAHSKYENGQERLTHFRWLSVSIEPSEDFMSESVVETVKAYTQVDRDGEVLFQEWRKDQSDEWVMTQDQLMAGVMEIPVRCSYFWRTGFYVGKPVFNDLADLNIVHWQSTSEQRFILSTARIPFLHIAGDNLVIRSQDTDGKTVERVFEISPHQVAMTPKDTDIKWVEHGGAAIQAGADDLKYLEEKMKELSRVLLTEKSGDITATAAAINSAEAQTTLKSMVTSFTQDIEQWLKMMAMYVGEVAAGISVQADTAIELPITTPAEQLYRDSQQQ
jgi:hypothetical protein